MLFVAGHLPSLENLLDAVEQVPSISASVPVDENSQLGGALLELVCNGVSFDLQHSKPASGIHAETLATLRSGTNDNSQRQNYDALVISAGSHVLGAENSIPIVKTWWLLASRLSAQLRDCIAGYWTPSKIMMTLPGFASSGENWSKTGMLPTEGLVAFVDDLDHGIRTVGMGFFSGQEVRIEPELTEDTDWAKRLCARIVGSLIPRKTLHGPEEITGPDGNRLLLEPSSNGKFVRVWRS